MKQELKPCPFCGEQPMVSEKTLSVYCKNALCPETIANESDNLTDAIRAWNTRPDHSGESAEMVKTLTTEIDWGARVHELQIALINQGLTDLYLIDDKVKSLINYQRIKSGDDRFNKKESDE